MVISLKYPQKFKKQHKNRFVRVKKLKIPLLVKKSHLSVVSQGNIISPSQQILPRTTLNHFKKRFRKFFLKKSVSVLFALKLNRGLSSKGKNARMGKGVGTINYFGYQLRAGGSILNTRNISSARAGALCTYLNKRLSKKIKYSV